jgi:hypothetical protein
LRERVFAIGRLARLRQRFLFCRAGAGVRAILVYGQLWGRKDTNAVPLRRPVSNEYLLA